MPRTSPQVVVPITPANMLANHQGAYAAGVTYQPGHWVVNEEQLWSCTKPSKGNTPAVGSEFWQLLGSIT